MARKWNYKNYQYSSICPHEDCNLQVIICPYCNNPGHEGYHKDTKNGMKEKTIDTITVVNHAHLIIGSDLLFAKARNFWHEIKTTEVSKEYYEKHFRLPQRNRMDKTLISKLKITKDDYK